MEPEQKTIIFKDSITNEEALIIIRVVKENIGVCLSLKNDGDVEVFFNLSDCQKFVDNLQKIIKQAKH